MLRTASGMRVVTFLFLFWFGGILGSAPGAEFPVSLSNHVDFRTHHSPESFTHLKTGWAQDAWLQWSYKRWYFHLYISHWHKGMNLLSIILSTYFFRAELTDITGLHFFLFWVILGANFPSPWETMLALRLDCPTAALTTHQKVLPIWKLVELKMLDFSDHKRTGLFFFNLT